jgi:hypothetical protein
MRFAVTFTVAMIIIGSSMYWAFDLGYTYGTEVLSSTTYGTKICNRTAGCAKELGPVFHSISHCNIVTRAMYEIDMKRRVCYKVYIDRRVERND